MSLHHKHMEDNGFIAKNFPTFKKLGAANLLSFFVVALLAVGVIFTVQQFQEQKQTRSSAQMTGTKDECLFSDPQAASLINNTPNPNKKPAFCDSFETLFPGGRGGDLDESRWSVARVTQNINTWEPTDAMFCLQKLTGVLPDKDSFICGLQFNEPNHWMSAMNDGGSYQYMSARPRQQFDFTGRTGIITFAVDAMTEGEHGWWPEVWVTDEPAPGPYNESPGIAAFPKNGIQISFGDQCASFPSLTHANVQRIRVFKNYRQVAEYSGQSGGFSQSDCYLTKADAANHFEIRINTNKVEVWGSDFTQDHGMTYPNFKLRAWTTLPLNLSFSRGYVHFEHIQYNAGKFGSSSMHTFHWHALGFDGPVLPMDRGYDVSDSLTPQDGGSVNIGYKISRNGSQTAGPFTLGNVDLTGATGASLNFNAHFMANCYDVGCETGSPLRYRLNGKTWHDIVPPFPFMWGMQRAFSVPISLSELTQGTNSLEFQITGVMDEINLANIDITVITNSTAPLPSSSPTNTPTPTLSLTPTPTPTSTPAPLTGSASMSIQPATQSVPASSAFTVMVHENSGTTPVNATQAVVTYPTALLRFDGFDTTTMQSAFPVMAQQTESGGTITIARGTTTPVSGNQHIVGLKFSVRAPAAANAAITLTSSSVLLSSQTNTNILSQRNNATVNITVTKTGDLNNDSKIDILDLSIFLNKWNSTDSTSDMNHDGTVNILDLSILLSQWGK